MGVNTRRREVTVSLRLLKGVQLPRLRGDTHGASKYHFYSLLRGEEPKGLFNPPKQN